MSEFKTIRNLASQAIGHRIGEGQFAKMYAELNRSGGVDNIVRDRLLTVIIAWIEQHEKSCVLTNGQKTDTIKEETANEQRNVHDTANVSATSVR